MQPQRTWRTSRQALILVLLDQLSEPRLKVLVLMRKSSAFLIRRRGSSALMLQKLLVRKLDRTRRFCLTLFNTLVLSEQKLF